MPVKKKRGRPSIIPDDPSEWDVPPGQGVEPPPQVRRLTKEERNQLRERNSDKITALSNRAKRAAATRNRNRGIHESNLIKTCISVDRNQKATATSLAGGNFSQAVREGLAFYIRFHQGDFDMRSPLEELEEIKKQLRDLEERGTRPVRSPRKREKT